MDIVRNNNSIKSRIVKKLIILSNYKNNTSSIENAKKYIEKNEKVMIDKRLFNEMEKKEFDNNIFYLYPKNSKNLVLYIHGGSFVEKPLKIQIKFIKKLTNKLKSDLIVPIYQTLPKGNAVLILEQMMNLYKKMLDKYDNIYLVGDSAGGGTVLSLSMEISKKDIKKPKAIISLSPWLDLTLSNDKINNIKDKDIVCSIEGNKYCGRLWSANIDEKDYRVNAKYGDVSKINNIFISSSKNEICNPDCIDFVNKLKKYNIKYQYIEYSNQFHNFELYPIKEANLLIEDVHNFVQEVSND